MELRHLRYFVAAAEDENVSRAALRLHVSQPGLSRQIHDLEAEIGFALFLRSPKSVHLTEAGKIFLVEARDVLQRAADAVHKARASIERTEEISVGYVPSGTSEILPRALRAFQEKFPRVRVVLHDMSAEEMLPELAEKKLDIALTVLLRKLQPGFAMQELARYAMCVAVAPTHLRSKSKFVTLDQMALEPVLTYSRKDYPEYEKHLESMFATVGLSPRIGGEYDGITSLIADVESGRGFALMPSCLRAMTGKRVKFLPLRPPLPPLSIVAVWRKEAPSELVEALVAAALGA